MLQLSFDALMAQARAPQAVRTVAFAGVISKGAQQWPIIRGLDAEQFGELLDREFPGVRPALALPPEGNLRPALSWDEFEGLVTLLLLHRRDDLAETRWLAHAIATAAMRENHLWQDMGLPSRKVLNDLLKEHFAALHAKNTGDMKWKKFFYRQLCEQQEIPICRSPSCGACIDYDKCFGPEEAVAPEHFLRFGAHAAR
jgi:nitrogen fixation protein NifQ